MNVCKMEADNNYRHTDLTWGVRIWLNTMFELNLFEWRFVMYTGGQTILLNLFMLIFTWFIIEFLFEYRR